MTTRMNSEFLPKIPVSTTLSAQTERLSARPLVAPARSNGCFSRGSATAIDPAWACRNAGSRPSLPLDAYAGTYRDGWYGDIRISVQD